MVKRAIRACVLTVLLAAAAPVSAGRLVISAQDSKWPDVDGDYVALDPAPPDTLVVLDTAAFPFKVVGQVDVHHSVIGPPMAVALSPDEKLALVSAPTRINPDLRTKFIRESFMQVVDLTTSPPTLIDRVALSTQAYGVSFNRAGTLALAAHIEGKISVLAIDGKTVTLIDTLTIGEPKSRVSHVQFTPDGKWALATRRGEGKVSVLKVEGNKVTYTGRDITVGFQPYGLDIAADGTYAAIADHGDEAGDVDEVTIVDLTREPFRAVEHVTVGQTPEGVALSPDSKWMAVANINGTNTTKATSPFWNDHSNVMLFRIEDKHATKVAEVQVGENVQGVVFTPDGKYIVVQNYRENELATYRMTGAGLEDTGLRIKVPGSPASLRTTD